MADRASYYLLRLDPSPSGIRSRANRAENYFWQYSGSEPQRCEISFLQERIRVEDIADHVGISYHYLKILFLRDMGMTLLDHINRSKIHRVEYCITEGGMTLEEAGETVGLYSAKYLSHLFHRCTGMTVREYRRIYREHTHTSRNTAQQGDRCE